jgi:hypothetical protein
VFAVELEEDVIRDGALLEDVACANLGALHRRKHFYNVRHRFAPSTVSPKTWRFSAVFLQ